METQNAGNAADLAILRDRAKILGIKSYQVMGYPKLYPLVMAAQDKKVAEQKAKDKAEFEAKGKKEMEERKKPKKETREIYPFTNPKTGQIEKYILTDKKNTIPHTAKGTAYVRIG